MSGMYGSQSASARPSRPRLTPVSTATAAPRRTTTATGTYRAGNVVHPDWARPGSIVPQATRPLARAIRDLPLPGRPTATPGTDIALRTGLGRGRRDGRGLPLILTGHGVLLAGVIVAVMAAAGGGETEPATTAGRPTTVAFAPAPAAVELAASSARPTRPSLAAIPEPAVATAAADPLQVAATLVPLAAITPTREPVHASVAPEPRVETWAPRRAAVERRPSDHPAVPAGVDVRVRVVTIRARVTAYTAWDHRTSKPEWADGVVAWHPGGRKRRVEHHPYGLATDWAQFPPGATYIRIPGYMEQSFPRFPEAFRVVDDACGASRKARARGLQPVIDVRYRTRLSAIHPRLGWGSRELPVEVIFPQDMQVPSSLRRWVVSEAWHTYRDGELTTIETIR